MRWVLASLSLLAASAFAAGGSSAATLDIAGPYGNDTGCKVLAGADYVTDDKIILHPDSIEAHESICNFVQVLTSKSGAAVITGLCEGEGSMWVRDYVVSKPDSGGDVRAIFLGDGELWAEVRPCG